MMARIYPDDVANPVGVLFRDTGGDFRMARIDDHGRVQVRGEDQLFSYKGQYRERVFDGNANAGYNSLNGTAVPSGEVWVVTHVVCYDTDNAFTSHVISLQSGGTAYDITRGDGAAAGVSVEWTGHLYLEEGDYVGVIFDGVTAGDRIYAFFFGYKMTLET